LLQYFLLYEQNYLIEAVAVELVTLMCASGQNARAVNPIVETKTAVLHPAANRCYSGHILLPVDDTI